MGTDKDVSPEEYEDLRRKEPKVSEEHDRRVAERGEANKRAEAQP